MMGYPPWQDRPPRQGRPPWQDRPPFERQTPHPPGKADPPCAVHTGTYGQQAGGMHPSGMQSC